jgi:hypothetical protein
VRWKIWRLLQNYIRCFAFNLKEVNQLKEQKVHIIFEDDNSISKQPYKVNEVERALVWAWTIKLLEVELFKGEYVSTIMMLTKWNIFSK